MNRFFVLAFIGLAACSPDDSDYVDVPLEVARPSNFPDFAYNFNANPPTEAGFELGKKIFYDGRLSSDATISCGFCHIQQHAFTHHGHSLSHGIDNAVGMRNTPAIQNMAFQNSFMWDGVSDNLDLQPIIPITSEIEMHGNFAAIVTMMQSDAQYRTMFKRAFPDAEIDTEHLLKALGQFMAMMQSSNSRFDKFRRNEGPGTLLNTEMAGYQSFQQKCGSCHATDLQTDNSFRNNGLSFNAQLGDFGRESVTGLASDRFKFRVPSLRNVEKTAPYMHDGRFYTLSSVLDHYASNMVDSPTLDPVLRQNGTIGIPLSDLEKSNIIAFLKTLTDEEFLTNPKFSEF
ncbi:cytochrome-c peroxidase [Flavobacterium selenitireducens]|uniref:cytochrome-c peroxidase n=1 Tax=Flavobacterium selenitireducens TaxID=2722704 RepID=UPI00168BCA8A|nr:cytochrome c peroxidase [Flavobacterium selenitireducens]MBD3581475.1 c-type cytochrome [Flavobacterium selenitireducens]